MIILAFKLYQCTWISFLAGEVSAAKFAVAIFRVFIHACALMVNAYNTTWFCAVFFPLTCAREALKNAGSTASVTAILISENNFRLLYHSIIKINNDKDGTHMYVKEKMKPLINLQRQVKTCKIIVHINFFFYFSMRISLASSVSPQSSNSVASVAQVTGCLPSPLSHLERTWRLILVASSRHCSMMASILAPVSSCSRLTPNS